MSRVVISVRPELEIDVAGLDMRFAGIRHMPVTDARGRLVGVVSQRDLLAAMAAKGGGSARIGDVMKAEVRTARPETPAHEAARLMMSEKIGCLPVIDEARRVVGMLTETDLLMAAEQALRAAAEPP